MASYNLGTARGQIELDASGAKKGAGEAGKSVDELTGKFSKASAGMGAAGGVLTAGAAVVAGGFALAVKTAASFEKQISAVGAVSGATGAELDRIREKALQLGKDTSFSASEAAIAMEELVKAGLSVDEVLNGAADSTVALAAAGAVDLPAAATLAANAMNAFGITAEGLPRVVDMIAGAANASAIDVGEFGQSLQQVGAVANLVGLSFDDTAVAIAELGNAGIKGSDAGTSLKTFLSNLQPVTDKQSEAFRQLNLLTFNSAKAMDFLRANGVKPLGDSQATLEKQLAGVVNKQQGLKAGSDESRAALEKLTASTVISDNAFFDAQGNLKSLRDVQQILQDSTAGLTDEQKTMALETLFGSDAIRAAAILAQNGGAGYDELAGAMGKVTAESVAQARLGNLSGQWEQLKGSLETVAITVGTLLLPALKSIVEFLTGLLNKFLSLSPGMQKAIVAFIAITAAIVGVIGVVLLIAAAIGAFMAAIAPLAAAIGIGAGALLGFIAVIPIIIAAIVALGILIYKNWDTIKAKTIEIFNSVKTFLAGVWASIVSGVTGAFASVAGAVGSAFNAVKNVFASVLGFFVGIITGVFNAIKTVITTYISVWAAVITGGLNIIKGIWSAIWGVFGGILTAVFDLIVAIIRLGLALAMYVINTVLNSIKAVFSAVWNAIVGVVRSANEAVANVIRAVWGAIGPYVMGVINTVRNVVSNGFNTVRAVIHAVMFAVRGVVSDVWNSIVGVISGAVSRVVATVRAVQAVAGIVRDAFSSAVGAARDQIGALIGIVSGLAGRVAGAVGNLGSILYSAGRSIIQGLINGVESMISSLTSKLSAITNLIPDSKGPRRVDMVLLEPAGEYIMGGLIRGLESQIPALKDTLGSVTTTIPQVVGSAPTGDLGRAIPTQAASGPVDQRVMVQVDAPQNMNPDEVGVLVARRVGYSLLTNSSRTLAPVGEY